MAVLGARLGRRRRASRVPRGRRGADAPVGIAFAVVDAGARDAHLYSMSVAPEARGRGAGAALVAGVLEWTRAGRARTRRTAVTVGNDAAARLYERAGFRDAGAREPLGHSDAVVAVLECDVRA